MINSAFILIALGRVIQVIIAFLTIKFVTNYLDQKSVAYYFLYLTILNGFGLALIGPIGQFVNRKLYAWKDQGVVLNRLAIYSLYVLLISFISLPITYILMSQWGLFHDMKISAMCGLVFFGLLFNSTITMVVPTFNMFNFRKAFVVLTSLWQSIALMTSIAFVLIFSKTILNWFAGMIVIQALFLIISTHLLQKFLRESHQFQNPVKLFTKKSISNVLAFSSPLVFSTGLMWFVTDGFRFLIERKYGLEQLALFSVGFAIATRFSYAIESIVQQIYYPEYYRSIEKAETQGQRGHAWNILFNHSFIFYLIVLLGTISLAPFLLRIFSGESYMSAIPFVIGGSIFHFGRKLTALWSIAAHAEMQTKLLLFPHFFASILLFTLLFFTKISIGLVLPISALCLFFYTVYVFRKLLYFHFHSLGSWKRAIYLLPLMLPISLWNQSGKLLYSIILGTLVMFYALFVCIKFRTE